MASATENLEIVVSLRGGRAVAADARVVEQSIVGIGSAARGASSAQGELASSTERTGRVLSSTLGIAIRYSAAYAAIHTALAALGSGFRLDATMEQNTVAFSHFLGSTQAATAELSTLYAIAAKTPFQFADVTSAARKFLAFGFSVSEANDELALLGDAVAGIGGGAEEINRLILAIGQIRAKGRLQGEELLQLTELGLVGTQQIAQQMGMTSAEFLKQVQRGKVGSEDAIRAINAVLREQFAGSAEEQSRTVIGQLSSIKDYGAQAMGQLVAPLFEVARSDVLPTILNGLRNVSGYLRAGGATEIYARLGDVLRILGPLTAALITYRGVVWGVTAAQGAWATALGSTTIAAGSLLLTARSLGEVLYVVGSALGFVGAAGGITIAGLAALVAGLVVGVGLLYWKWKGFRDAVNDTISTMWSGLTAVLGLIKQVADFFAHPFGKRGGFQVPNPLGFLKGIDLPFMATGGTIPVGGAAIVGDAGMEVAQHTPGGTIVTPVRRGQGSQASASRAAGPAQPAPSPRVLQPVHFSVDGRVFAEIVLDIGQTAAARA